ncbi:unnamed protein product, partial [Dovyalis caffra]
GKARYTNFTNRPSPQYINWPSNDNGYKWNPQNNTRETFLELPSETRNCKIEALRIASSPSHMVQVLKSQQFQLNQADKQQQHARTTTQDPSHFVFTVQEAMHEHEKAREFNNPACTVIFGISQQLPSHEAQHVGSRLEVPKEGTEPVTIKPE